jgi:hypothetical protein
MKNLVAPTTEVDLLIAPSKMTKKDFEEISAYIKKHKSENSKATKQLGNRSKTKKSK